MSVSLGTITVGDDREILLIFSDSNGVIDISGYLEITVTIWQRGMAGDNDPEIVKTIGSGVVVSPQTGGTTGQAVVTVDAADWAPWADITDRIKMELEVERQDAAGKLFTPDRLEFNLDWQKNK